MSKESQSEFAMLYIQNQGRVYGYIATLIPNRSDAEDILQRTSMVMWQKWDQYDPDRGFVSWARGIALNEIRNFLRRSERKNVHLSEAVVDMLAEQIETSTDPIRAEAFEQCFSKLERKQRSLLEQCYLESMGVKVVADALGTTRDAIYMRLHRIRKSLINCMNHQLSDDNVAQQRV
ncbi:sigma-70 family RNA polymerase sigma factor [Roseiconus nitratireducens]|uniref:Sigma-70 family RNA polymerase sigma factor n=1 Tax=Roseiconus nitratireducens TaxID=2605748 RepID=A0A5M6CZJ6_9BACT|nr:sigma-70 family RNA polymerase sigma factor [Roseiconus nitratireducens]KAA5538699.1 sigma-70 family RNA polymerase sigma factor [Roseiconus nitratireducens]